MVPSVRPALFPGICLSFGVTLNRIVAFGLVIVAIRLITLRVRKIAVNLRQLLVCSGLIFRKRPTPVGELMLIDEGSVMLIGHRVSSSNPVSVSVWNLRMDSDLLCWFGLTFVRLSIELVASGRVYFCSVLCSTPWCRVNVVLMVVNALSCNLGVARGRSAKLIRLDRMPGAG